MAHFEKVKKDIKTVFVRFLNFEVNIKLTGISDTEIKDIMSIGLYLLPSI